MRVQGDPDAAKNGVFYLLNDHLGSTTITLKDNGTSVTEYGQLRYTAWGEMRYTQGETPTDYRFTGKRLAEETGLYFYGSRWYDPYITRFTQPDSIVPLASQGVQAFDRYAYANNNPVRYNDPTGHSVPLPPSPFSNINITVSDGWDLIAAAVCFVACGFLPVHYESNGLGQGVIVGDKAPKLVLPMVAGVQLSPEAAALSRPDLFRGGSSTDPNFGLKTPEKPYSDGSFDIVPDASGNVGPGSGGLSTLSEPKPNWQNPWKYPSSAPDPEGIRIFQDNPVKDPRHWLWEPAWEMPLKQFKQFLKHTFENWGHPE